MDIPPLACVVQSIPPKKTINLQQFVALGIRFFSIFLWTQSFFYLVSVPAEIANTNLASQSYLAYGIGALGLVAGIMLWAFPMFIAKRMVPGYGLDRRENLNAFDVSRVGCSLIGLWFFASALPAMLWFVFVGMSNAESGQSVFQSLQPEEKVKLGYYSAQLALSFLLIFKAHIFASFATRNMEITETNE